VVVDKAGGRGGKQGETLLGRGAVKKEKEHQELRTAMMMVKRKRECWRWQYVGFYFNPVFIRSNIQTGTNSSFI
jgi:hypothetical protein